MSYFPSGDTELIARQGYGDLGLSFSDIKSGAGGLLGGALSFYGESQKTAGRAAALEEVARQQAAAAAARQTGGTPGWVLPVALGGGALLLVMMMRRRK